MSHLVSLNKNVYIRALSPWTNGNSRCSFSLGAGQTGSGDSSDTSEDGVGISHQEFQRWHNGGGTFPKSACIDPTVLIEMGAKVHPKSVVGAYVHIGSGTVIGPHVTISQLTKIGRSFFFMQHQRYCN
nr:putative udp-3-o-acylglucosamine n-acyltransferase 2, mitochondrial [Quercus suber]